MIFRKTSKIGFFTYVFLCLLPIFTLVFSFSSDNNIDFSFSYRQLGLLFNTIVLGLAVAIIAAFLGFFAALYIKNSSFRNKKYRWAFLFSLAISRYVYALAMMSFLNLLEDVTRLSLKGFYQGFIPSLMVEILIFLPVLTGLILLKLESIDGELIESGRLYNSYNGLVLEVILPALMPAILFGSAIVFTFSSTDFTVPSLFQYNVYAMDIFSDFSANSSATRAVFLSLPLILVNLVSIYAIGKFLPEFFIRNTGKKVEEAYELRGVMKCLAIFSSIIVFGQSVVAVLMLILETDYLSFFYALRDFGLEYYYSILTAIIAVCFSIFLSAFAMNFYINRWAKGIYLLALVFLLALPSSLTAIGFLLAVNSSIFHQLASTIFMTGIGMGIRFLPLVFILFLPMFSQLDRDVLEAGKMYRSSDFSYFKKILLPMSKRGVFFIAVLIFLLSFGEVDLSLILAAAGKVPISISIFNALHYGQSDIVCAKSLYLIFSNLIFVFIAYVLIFRRGKYE